MDTLTDARNDFYKGVRTELLPWGVNDTVTVRGKSRDLRASIISLESISPIPEYLVEFEDGSDEIVSLADIVRKQPIA